MYEKLLLKNGDALNDFHINHIQEGIGKIDKDLDLFKEKVVKILKGKGVPASKNESLDELSQKINYLGTGYIKNDSDNGELIEEIDIRETVQSGQIQLLCSDVTSGYVEILVWTKNGTQYSVDWGDGNVEFYGNGAVATHQYVSGIGGSPYLEANTQWTATIKADGNVIRRFLTRGNSDIIWFASKNVYFDYMYSMFSNGETSIHSPKGLKYVDFIGGSLSCETEKNCGYVFRSCDSLRRVSGSINLAGATSVYQMFLDCRKLEELPEILNLSSVTQAGYMFQDCESLKAIPNLVSTKSLVHMSYMFRYCRKITELPVMDVENALNAAEFAAYCDALEDIRKIKNMGKIQNAAGMFRDCQSLRQVPSTMDFGSVLDASNLFVNCISLVDAPSTLYIGSATNIYRLFYNCKSMRTAPNALIAPNATSSNDVFYNCTVLRQAPATISLPNTRGINSFFAQCKSLVAAPEIMNFEEVIDANDLFYACDMLSTPPREVVMPKVINAYSMFNSCVSLKTTPVKIELPMAQKVDRMFQLCRLLTETKFTELNFPEAIQAQNMFNGCRSLKKAPKLYLPKAQDTTNMFYLCEQLVEAEDVDLPASFTVEGYYRDCLSLEHAPAINAPMATRWNYTYNNCPILQSIESLGGPSAQTFDHMCWNSPKLMDFGTNVIDLTNVSNTTNWYHTNDPMYLSGSITIKGGKTGFHLRNCRNLTSIRYIDMDPLCGTLDFRNCAMEAETINLLFGDLIRTTTPQTIKVTGNPGAASCNPSIAEAKGWTVER